MANRDIFGVREKKDKTSVKKVNVPANEKPTEERLMATVTKRSTARPSLRGDMFGVTSLPDGPAKTVELTPVSEEDVFGTPKKKEE